MGRSTRCLRETRHRRGSLPKAACIAARPASQTACGSACVHFRARWPDDAQELSQAYCAPRETRRPAVSNPPAHAAASPWRTPATIRGPSKHGSGIATSSIRCATRNWRPIDSRISGGIDGRLQLWRTTRRAMAPAASLPQLTVRTGARCEAVKPIAHLFAGTE